MAKPRIFISSTYYDLKYIRAELDGFIEEMGYQAVRHEEGEIPYGRDLALEAYCLKEISNVDILISIIGGRFGSESRESGNSISQMELRMALEQNKQVYVFIDNNVAAEYETYLLNKEREIRYKHADDKRIYSFIEELKKRPINNTIKTFERGMDIIQFLREQWAGLFHGFLQSQSRLHEVNLIQKLDSSAKVLDTLVSYLSEVNKESKESLQSVLQLNHPLVDSLKDLLNIHFQFLIQDYDDLNAFLKDLGFSPTHNVETDYCWEKCNDYSKKVLKVNKIVFDSSLKLIAVPRSHWIKEWVSIINQDLKSPFFGLDDDLPF